VGLAGNTGDASEGWRGIDVSLGGFEQSGMRIAKNVVCVGKAKVSQGIVSDSHPRSEMMKIGKESLNSPNLIFNFPINKFINVYVNEFFDRRINL
jgi:hypothetical protein